MGVAAGPRAAKMSAISIMAKTFFGLSFEF